jgi:RNA polymerase sigma-70 factor (ECF subfamily)
MGLTAFLAAPPEAFDSNAGESNATPRRSLASPTSPALHDVDARDLELAQRIRGHDEPAARHAFDALYAEYFTPLWRLARQFVSADATAKDIVHDVFAAIWMKRTAWIVSGAVRTYLYRAVRNRGLNVIRDNAATTSWAFEDADAGAKMTAHLTSSFPRNETIAPDAGTEFADLESALALAVDALPERQRTALLLFWHESMNMSEVARVLGVTPAASRKLLLAAQATLRRSVSEYL